MKLHNCELGFLVVGMVFLHNFCLPISVLAYSSCYGLSVRKSTPFLMSSMIVEDNEDPLFNEITPEEFSGELPTQLTYPFHYEPHPVAVYACDRLKEELTAHSSSLEGEVGKMFGVLVVRRPSDEKLGYLKAYSGTLKTSELQGFCPMIFDRMDPNGFYKRGEAELNDLNRQVEALERDPELEYRKGRLAEVEEYSSKRLSEASIQQKERKRARKQIRLEHQATESGDPEEYERLEYRLVQESAADQREFKALKSELQLEVAEARSLVEEIEDRLTELKQLRKNKSEDLQNRLFHQYQFLNIRGETASVLDLFALTPLKRPPGGAGDCAAPKLFQVAFANGYIPIAMAEFWWGESPALEIRKHNFYYPACRGKCEPILAGHMLKGMDVEDNPLQIVPERSPELEILYEDEYIAVINKPPGLLSVPGRQQDHSVYTEMRQRYPNATGPLLVHRLDMSTSGILLVAKDKDTHEHISKQFIARSIKKRYESLLEGELSTTQLKGKIDLPLIGDYLNRPMQKVDFDAGKDALTYYEVLNSSESGRTRVYFYPTTGRTHQLRVHAAHAMGLNLPIVGDDIYGQRDERLCLHAGLLEMTHPATGKRLTFTVDAPF